MLRQRENRDWQSFLTDKQYTLFQDVLLYSDLEYDDLSELTENPMKDQLRFFVEHPITDLTMVYIVFQLYVFDNQNGPEKDGQLKGMRRHWYLYFKVDFAQPLSLMLNKDLQKESWGRDWFGKMSVAYSNFADYKAVLYKDLWIADTSRLFFVNEEELYPHANIIIAVEKDSLFGDFEALTRRLGAIALYSGKGVPSRAACEKLLENLPDMIEDRFSEQQPLVVLTISDFDYSGKVVINKALASHFIKYTPFVKWGHVGVYPSQLVDNGYSLIDKGYTTKMGHKTAKKWVFDEAVKLAQCWVCGTQVMTSKTMTKDSLFVDCDKCGEQREHSVLQFFGYEVESMFTIDYYPIVVETLLHIVEYDFIVEGIRQSALPDLDIVTDRLVYRALDQNPHYRTVYSEYQNALTRVQNAYNKHQDAIRQLAERHQKDFIHLEPNPPQEDLYQHVVTRGSNAWQPFDIARQEIEVINFINSQYPEDLDQLENDTDF